MTDDAQSRPAPVRVLWLITGLARGGAEQLLVAAAKRLDRNRFDVEVAYVLAGYDALVPALEELGITAHCLQSNSVASTRWVRRLRDLVKVGGFDIVHTHSPAPAVMARVATSRRTAFIHTEHNVWSAYRLPARLANAATYRRNAAVIAVSNSVAQSITLPGALRPPIEVVYHGIDDDAAVHGPAARSAGRRLLDMDDDALVIGSVGNFRPAKGHATLITAFAELASGRSKDLRLVLVGFGPLESQLRLQAVEAGLDGQVVFAGSRDDVQAILPAFDVFALPSRQEGLGLAMLEAMGAGIPCVASHIPAVTESLQEGEAGLLVPPENPAALAAAIGALLDDEQLRATMGRKGQEVAARFSLDTAVQRLSAIYEQVAGTGAPSHRGVG